MGDNRILPTPAQDETWKTGDFTLISSDNVKFKVPGHHLSFSSQLFRDALTLGEGPREVHLTDPVSETAEILRIFLDIALCGRLEVSPDITPQVHQLRALKGLFDKWDVAALILRITHLCLADALRTQEISALHGFCYATAMDDIELCTMALRKLSVKRWTDHHDTPSTAIKQGSPDQCTLNPNTFPLVVWKLVPHPYLWALSRAWTSQAAGTVVPDTDKLAARFQELVIAAREHPQGSP